GGGGAGGAGGRGGVVGGGRGPGGGEDRGPRRGRGGPRRYEPINRARCLPATSRGVSLPVTWQASSAPSTVLMTVPASSSASSSAMPLRRSLPYTRSRHWPKASATARWISGVRPTVSRAVAETG